MNELIKRLRDIASWDWNGGDGEYVERAVKEAADAIEELSKLNAEITKRELKLRMSKPRWIPATERLPFAESGNVSKTVLVTDGKCVALAEWFNFEECEPYWSYTGIGDVTHWMPLPEPPEEG